MSQIYNYLWLSCFQCSVGWKSTLCWFCEQVWESLHRTPDRLFLCQLTRTWSELQLQELCIRLQSILCQFGQLSCVEGFSQLWTLCTLTNLRFNACQGGNPPTESEMFNKIVIHGSSSQLLEAAAAPFMQFSNPLRQHVNNQCTPTRCTDTCEERYEIEVKGPLAPVCTSMQA